MPDENSRFELCHVEIDFTIGDAFPRIIVGQPFFKVNAESQPNFQIASHFRQKQIDFVKKCFAVRDYEQRQGWEPIRCIILPEFALPFPEGIKEVVSGLSDVNSPTVFVGGVEGIRPDQIDSMGNLSQFREGVTSFGHGNFLNLCLIAIRNDNGHIRYWLQQKVWPSHWEQGRNNSTGQEIYYFKGEGCSFLCEICSDHSSGNRGRTNRSWV